MGYVEYNEYIGYIGYRGSLSLIRLISRSGIKLSVEQAAKAQKYCKYAISSLDYDDLPTTILNLNKALHLCQTGTELQ